MLNPFHLFRTNADLRAEVTDLTRALAAVNQRNVDLLVEGFHRDSLVEQLRTERDEANAALRHMWKIALVGRDLIVALKARNAELEAKLAPFVRRARDPVTKRFVGVGK